MMVFCTADISGVESAPDNHVEIAGLLAIYTHALAIASVLLLS